MKIDIKKIILTEGIVFAVVMLAGPFTIFRAEIDRTRELNRQIREFKPEPLEIFTTEDREKYNKLKKELEWIAGEISSIKEKIDYLNARLPENIDMEQLVEHINKTAESSNLEMASVRPEPVKTVNDYKELNIEVKLRGRYSDFLNYISSIVVPEEGIYLDRASLRTDDTIYPNLNIDLVLVVFSRL